LVNIHAVDGLNPEIKVEALIQMSRGGYPRAGVQFAAVKGDAIIPEAALDEIAQWILPAAGVVWKAVAPMPARFGKSGAEGKSIRIHPAHDLIPINIEIGVFGHRKTNVEAFANFKKGGIHLQQ
jgi:hypothetical protein